MGHRLFVVAPCFVILWTLGPQLRDGFADIPWGTEFDFMKERYDLVPTAGGKNKSQYLSNVAKAGKAETGQCEFEFSNGRFSGVIVTTRGGRNSHALLAYLKGAYGGGIQENPLAYQWFAGDTHASYDEDREGNAYVYIYSLSLQSRQESVPHR